jgi:hypothetical protein
MNKQNNEDSKLDVSKYNGKNADNVIAELEEQGILQDT